ncbi:MAG: C40 family peptidase [Oscillospiraceae bacterium]|nr:C40 family peptidase [Oscillospiraceae bacterium]
MHSKKLLTRALFFVLCVLMLSATILPAAAREVILGCEYVRITENGFVADTFMGVEARYNLGGPKLYCSELIPRFVRDVYGVEMVPSGVGPYVNDDSGCRFEEPAEAQPGDILFATAAARGKGYNHWAICKSVDPEHNVMTVFEQNWRWNGCAAVDRVIPLHGSCYRVYRLVTDEGRVPTLSERAAQEAALAQPVVQSNENLLRQAIRTAELFL